MYHAIHMTIHIYMYVAPLKWKISCFCHTRAPHYDPLKLECPIVKKLKQNWDSSCTADILRFLRIHRRSFGSWISTICPMRWLVGSHISGSSTLTRNMSQEITDVLSRRVYSKEDTTRWTNSLYSVMAEPIEDIGVNDNVCGVGYI